MPCDTELLEHLYDRFNARDMEAALATIVRTENLNASVAVMKSAQDGA